MRITEKRLSEIVRKLNHITASPIEPYTTTESGLRANVKNFHIKPCDGGGFRLVRIDDTYGSVSEIGLRGTKRELYYQIGAFINGFTCGYSKAKAQ